MRPCTAAAGPRASAANAEVRGPVTNRPTERLAPRQAVSCDPYVSAAHVDIPAVSGQRRAAPSRRRTAPRPAIPHPYHRSAPGRPVPRQASTRGGSTPAAQYPAGGTRRPVPGPGQYPGGQYPGRPVPGQASTREASTPAGAVRGRSGTVRRPAYAAADPLVATSFSDWLSKIFGVVSRSWQPLLIIQLATVRARPMLVASIVLTAAGTDSHRDRGRRRDVGCSSAVLILFVVALLAQGASVFVVGKQASGQAVGGRDRR